MKLSQIQFELPESKPHFNGRDVRDLTMKTIVNIKTADSTLNGLVLAGGYSTRMGTDKSLLVYNGRPQREFLFELLKKYCDDAFVSCRKEQQVPAVFNPLFDRFDLAGPLNGILSAFQHMSSSWLAVAVDMPFVDDRAIGTLLLNRDKTKLATCYFNKDTQQPEPLLTIWETHAYAHLFAYAKNGNVSPREFLKTHPVRMINPPDDNILRNVNYPGDVIY